MSVELDQLLEHDMSDDCPICRAQDLVSAVLIPASAAWEHSYELPKFSVALYGAAELLGVMLAEGVPREEVETVLSHLLDDIELHIAEDRTMGGPPQGSA